VNKKQEPQLKWYAGDIPAKDDSLGFKDYVEVLYKFIRQLSVEKDTPLCIGIHGEWGSGKTSLMKQLQERLKNEGTEDSKVLTVWFDAWKYDKTEVHWATLVQVVISEIWKDIKLQEWLKDEAEKALKEKGYRILRKLGRMSKKLGIAVISGGLKRIHPDLDIDYFREEDFPPDRSSSQEMMKSDFQREIEFQSELKDGFKGIIEDYFEGEKGKLVIFMDDLDRCLPENVINVLEAAKNYIDTEGCVFVVGVDEKAIEAGVKVRYGKDSRIWQDLKKDYIEKIVQLPFVFPRLTVETIRDEKFLTSIGAEEFDDYLEILEMGLGLNPRKIKRLRNVFHLLKDLKDVKKLKKINDSLLLNVLILQYRWRGFYDKMVKEGKPLLIEIQKILDEKEDLLDKSRFSTAQAEIFPDFQCEEDLSWGFWNFLRNTKLPSQLIELGDESWTQLINLSAISQTKPVPEEEEMSKTPRASLVNIQDVWKRFGAAEALGTQEEPEKLKQFITIPSGKYAFQDENRNINEFALSKYTVVNSWFNEFLEDKGYENTDYWSREGWQWKKENEIVRPKYWENEKWSGSNFPVVGVSWYEAEAFCDWLNSKDTGFIYNLPNEQQWEAAARGEEGRMYPWGDDKDMITERLNCQDVGLNRTSPVGMFPKGNTPEGISDMAGNVWEWCKDLYSNIRSDRVLRGGGWSFFAKNCTATTRDWDNPVNRIINIGFRLARVRE